MSKKIEFIFCPREDNFLHEDFVMKISSLNQAFVFDSYYIALGLEIESQKQLFSVIENHLNKCKKAILGLPINQFVYIPVDISDQYYGAFKITKDEINNFFFEYGGLEKIDTISLSENNGQISLEIANNDFQVDYSLNLSTEDVIESFSSLSPG